MLRRLFITILFCLGVTFSHAQTKSISFSELEDLQAREPRNVLVFIHTDWCLYCQAMQQTIFKNKEVLNLLNSKFYTLFLNAEEKKEIFFHNTSFKFKPTGNGTGVNELAEALATVDGQVSYPTICLLNSQNEIIYQQTGYLTTAELKIILKNFK